MTDILLIIAIIMIAVLIALVIVFRPKQNNERIVELSNKLDNITSSNYQQQIKILETLSENSDKQSAAITNAVNNLQANNEMKLEQMRQTVDEKLSDTLNKRINSSFEQVSVQLQNVYKSLGEMKTISEGVTDNVQGLNRVLTNVKARGTWAEYQLENILEQTIPKMYQKNVKTNPKYNGQVEFAVKIPNSEDDSIVWLPIDSKFPMEDYSRLVSASEAGDLSAVELARKALESRVKDEAKTIKSYISQPETTPFAIMYLATEGLYAEIMSSKSGIAEKIQNDGILIAGPSTVTALLNSLQIGFSSIAINKRANEVWKVLGNAKKQYDTFGLLLEKAKRKIEEAGKTIDEADHRNDIIQKNLKSVNSLPEAEEL
ncbi:MAG: DNA recombination protein RmuC [Eubacterium sp.]